MALKLRPTGLGSGIDKDRPTTQSLLASGRPAASTDPRRSGQSALVLVDERQWPDDALGPRGHVGRG